MPLMLAWVFFIAVLGVTMAIPMKRQMINIEQLRFPSGIAAAETLSALHARSSQGLRAAKALELRGARCRGRQGVVGGAIGNRTQVSNVFRAAPFCRTCRGGFSAVTTKPGRAARSSFPGISSFSPLAPSLECEFARPCSSQERCTLGCGRAHPPGEGRH